MKKRLVKCIFAGTLMVAMIGGTVATPVFAKADPKMEAEIAASAKGNGFREKTSDGVLSVEPWMFIPSGVRVNYDYVDMDL